MYCFIDNSVASSPFGLQILSDRKGGDFYDLPACVRRPKLDQTCAVNYSYMGLPAAGGWMLDVSATTNGRCGLFEAYNDMYCQPGGYLSETRWRRLTSLCSLQADRLSEPKILFIHERTQAEFELRRQQGSCNFE